jgi:hypothetical protein
MGDQPERMTMAEVLRLAREGRLEGTWQGGADGVFIRVSNEGIHVSKDERHLPAVIPQPEPAQPAAMSEGQPPPMEQWGADTIVLEPMRPKGAGEYVKEALEGGAVLPPGGGVPARERMGWGPYRGQRIADVPTEALAEMRTMFENGAPPEVEAELRRRGV